MLGAATQAMPLCIVEERQQRRRPLAAAPLRAAARWLRCSLLTYRNGATGMLVGRALPAGLGASSKVQNVILWRALRTRRREEIAKNFWLLPEG